MRGCIGIIFSALGKRKTMLYGRQHPEGEEIATGCCLEHDVASLEELRAAARRALINPEEQWEGFDFNGYMRRIDNLEEAFNHKLAGTRLILNEKTLKRKSGKYMFVIERAKKPWLKQSMGKWVETTKDEVRAAQKDGKIIEKVRGRWNSGRKYTPVNDEFVTERVMEYVTRERAIEARDKQGECVMLCIDGDINKHAIVHFEIRGAAAAIEGSDAPKEHLQKPLQAAAPLASKSAAKGGGL